MNQNISNQTILTYDDLIQQEEGSVDEKLVDITSYDDSITAEYIKLDMLPITGSTIFIRDTIARKIASIESNLSSLGFKLRVVYGYRHPDVQLKYFNNRKLELKKQYPDVTDAVLNRIVHNFVADPAVAGHPAGAAVDLTLTYLNGEDVDMGSGIADYSSPDKIITFAENLTSEQAENRKILHDAMISEGFAPFYGEWWHFSYGDKEWAAFYEKKALYGAINFSLNS